MVYWINDIRSKLGITVLMVEHDMTLVNRVSDRVVALNCGQVLALGTPDHVTHHSAVIAAYLGTGTHGDPAPLLSVHNLETSYGRISAVRGVGLKVPHGQIVTVLGPTVQARPPFSRLLPAFSIHRRVRSNLTGKADPRDGLRPDAVPPPRIEPCARRPRGLSVPYRRRELDDEGTYRSGRRGARSQRIYGYFRGSSSVSISAPGCLGGEQQMLAISQAFSVVQSCSLFGEPSLGLAPLFVRDIFAIVRRLNDEEGISILLVEQNAHMALETARYGYVLEVGRFVMADTCRTLRQPRHTGILPWRSRDRHARRTPLEATKDLALSLRSIPHGQTCDHDRRRDLPKSFLLAAATRGDRPACARKRWVSGRPSAGTNG